MAIKLGEESEKYLVGSIKRFFLEELDVDIGDLKAMLVLDFCLREIGPSVYNRAIADAQVFVEEKALELSDARYEVEFDFWKRQRDG